MFINSLTPSIRQMVAAVCAGVLTTAAYTSWGFSAVALPQMNLPESPVNFTPEMAGWFATIPMLLSIPGTALGSVLCERIGPRRLQLVVVPLLAASMLGMVAGSWQVLQDAGVVEEFLLGTLAALFTTPAIVYTYEVCDSHRRGALTSCVDMWVTLGFLLCYLLGCYLPWQTMAWVLPVSTSLPAYCGLLLVPESPLWLARRGRNKEALENMMLLRNSSDEILEELQVVRNSTSKGMTIWKSLQVAKDKPNLLAILFSSLVLMLKEMCGFIVFSIYIVYIFQQAGVGISLCWSSVFVGLTRLVCNLTASLILHKAPRRLLLMAGCSLIFISVTAIGIFFYLQSGGYNVSRLSWLPMTSLLVFMVGYAGGVGPTSWIVAMEVLPGPVRSLGYGISSIVYYITSFAISKSFESVKELIGLHGVFWCYSIGSVLYCLAVVLFVPETLGMSPRVVEEFWHRRAHKKKYHS
ncbi:Facilitated trehalose transporter Tret1-like 13 [Homarus americanus]|uniref:Facilitated trehalose transporter Tret1-like 13 n=1 Tax=Homarus americanus TaxID=6706 RepID=A0A8J5N1G4_HOMAM|nr:Facilitated trehalose transporter Tret1-like 13 [Homarus americanus]